MKKSKTEPETFGPACGPAGCEADRRAGETAADAAAMTLDVFSDAICPWCYVGKRRLGRALDLLRSDGTGGVAVRWRAFELNPRMPVGGMDRRTYRSAKFGSWERSQTLDAQVAEAARNDGLRFRHDLMTRTPNTRDAHRLTWLAGRLGVQDAVVEAIFRAYFTEGRDVGDRATLIDIAEEAGLDRDEADALFLGEEGLTEVVGDEREAARLGLAGVPAVVLGGRPLFAGAVPPAEIASTLRRSFAGEDV